MLQGSTEPTSIGAAVLALTNSLFAAGTLLGVWSLSTEAIASLQLVIGNVIIVLVLVGVRSHTVTTTENREQVASALATPAPKV